MKTQYYTATSIDGFIADADNSLEWLFSIPESPGAEGMKEEYPTFIADVGALAMGSTTYEWIAAYTGFLDDPSKWDYAQPTWVFSSREPAAARRPGHPVRLRRRPAGARRDGRGGGGQERLDRRRR